MRRVIRRTGEHRPPHRPQPPLGCGPDPVTQHELTRIGEDVEEAMRRYAVAFSLATRAAEAFKEARRIERDELRKLGVHRQAENALRARLGLPPLSREMPTDESARKVLTRMANLQTLEGEEPKVWRAALARMSGGEE